MRMNVRRRPADLVVLAGVNLLILDPSSARS
jgi:hypothetical protein